MSRKTKGARLHQRRNIYHIRDGTKTITTGTRDHREAEAALARYIAERNRPTGPGTPDKVTVAEVLDLYGTEHAPTCKDTARIAYAIEGLLPTLGALPVSTIMGATCRRYAKMRNRAPGTIRKELGVLQAAINYCHAEGYLTAAVRVKMPPKPAPRDRWLSRNEVARLLRVARRNPKSRHLCRFILMAIYTGTRKDALLRLQFMPNTQGGYINTKTGTMYRRGVGEVETKKRQPPIPIPRQLLAHLRRWERNGSRYVIEADRMRIASIKTAWRTALAESGIDHCTPHDLRRTAVTWAMQHGVDKWAACGYFGLTLEILESVYGHHHPDHLESAVRAMENTGKLVHVPDSAGSTNKRGLISV